MKPTRFRTKMACSIARISPDRFNEAYAAGNYPCAPATERGSARVFDMTGLITLFIYGRLLEQGFPPNKAGHFACKVGEVLMYDRGESEITLALTSTGRLEAYGSVDFPNRRRTFSNGGLIIERMSFDIENIRTIVEREIDEELSIAGEDD